MNYRRRRLKPQEAAVKRVASYLAIYPTCLYRIAARPTTRLPNTFGATWPKLEYERFDNA